MTQTPRVAHHVDVDLAQTDLVDAVFATRLGLTLDGWQAYAAEVASQPDESGTRPQDVVILTGRQNGKTELALTRAVRAAMDDHHNVLIATQGQSMARDAHHRVERVLCHLDGVERVVERIRRAVDKLSVEFVGGGRIVFRTYNGHGGEPLNDVDLIVVDEAQEIAPATAAYLAAYVLRTGGQIWWLATAPAQDSRGLATLAAMRHRALVGRDRSIAWLEWSAPPPVISKSRKLALTDDYIAAALRVANPAIESGRLSIKRLTNSFHVTMPHFGLCEHLGLGAWPPFDAEVTVGG